MALKPPPSRPRWDVSPRPFDDPACAALLREYLVDVADRWYELRHGRASTAAEIEKHLAEMPSDDLAPPRGVLLVAHHGGEPVGCAGLRLLDDRTAELKRVFVQPARRGLGGGGALLTAAEATARQLGAVRIVLDTRLDLIEARALYARHGYVDVLPYTDDPLAEVWLGKRLRA